ncbi:MAG: DUF2442 domain-containing protein [Deltaproteobacteria bacterium]|nr:DUF2442 domain-containing protein [Deltaproteobacteria bacterium]
MILHIVEAEVCGPHSLRVVFDDGTQKRVNLLPLLEGPVFEPLRDPAYFARVSVDPICRTVVWPNGADLAPEALYELSPEQESIGATPDITS